MPRSWLLRMGGNALKHLQPVRLTSAQVTDLMLHLHRNWQLVDGSGLSLVPWVAEKADHGDLDVICDAEPATVLRFAPLVGVDPRAIVRNDRVLSMPVPLPWERDRPSPRVAQVDMICASTAQARSLRFFYSGGDFGMLLGRVAAWHGLVFGMDGLRYRADRAVPWQSDVLLTHDPATILRVLGSPPVLPWFATYDALWRFVLSSPMAGPWMFLPDATNHENRSRDRQRRKIGDFQAWLAAEYPNRLTPPAPRATPAQAQAWVHRHFPDVDLLRQLDRQHTRFAQDKARTRVLGVGSVEDVLGPGYDRAVIGAVVRAMQPFLPTKRESDLALRDPVRWPDLIRLARAAAAAVAAAQGLPTKTPPPIPDFLPPT